MKNQQYLCGLTDEEIQSLTATSFHNLCENCGESGFKYFCVDSLCKKRQLVCWNCNENNLAYAHYGHSVVHLKSFLKADKLQTLKQIIREYEELVEMCEENTLIFQDLSNMTLKLENEMKRELLSLRKRLFKTQTLEQKLKAYKEQKIKESKALKVRKDEKIGIKDIFNDFEFQYPFTYPVNVHQKLQRMEQKLNQVSLSSLMQEKKSYYQYYYDNNFFQTVECPYFVAYKSQRKFSQTKKRQIDSPEGRKIFVNKYIDQISLTYHLKNITSLQMNFTIEESYLKQVLKYLPHLKQISIRFLYSRHQNLKLSHKNLEKIKLTTNFFQVFNEIQYFNRFLDVESFPRFQSVVIREGNISNLKQLLNNIGHVKSIEFYSYMNQQIFVDQELKTLIFKVLRKRQLNTIIIHRLMFYEKDFWEMQQILWKSTMLYYTNLGKEFSWRSIAYSFVKYHKYKNISKRTYKNLVLSILN